MNRYNFTRLLIALTLLFSLTLIPDSVVAQGFSVRGSIHRASSKIPIPGLTVSLVHPRLGRSVPAISDRLGQYVFLNVPVDTEPYFLEIYWGRALVFRVSVTILGPTDIPPIFL